MTDAERKEAARQFINRWQAKKGYEKGETQKFWIELLTVVGVANPTEFIEFEKPVVVKGNTKYIDAFIPETKVLIEQKGSHVDLDKPEPQSGGDFFTPFEQAFRYRSYLNYDEHVRWIVVCNFKEIRIHDMKDIDGKPQIIRLENLREDINYLDFLKKTDVGSITREFDLSQKAGDIVGEIYNALKKQYKNPEDKESLKSLNALCVRLVFCFFAEDAGLFEFRQFHDYMKKIPAAKWHRELRALFKMLNTDYSDRNPYDEAELQAFPFVNGGLFDGSNNEIPAFTDEIVNLILNVGCSFDWKEISPTIFGAVFESTLNPETRRNGGMHYTSIENIHKVIDPLFLDDLRKELEVVKQAPIAGGSYRKQLQAFQKKLSGLIFFDPACGSGNFLTETFLSIRRLENEVIRCLLVHDENQMAFDDMADISVMVSISQFYGIEINDFAVAVARTAMWIAEAQMRTELGNTDRISSQFLPLHTNAFIVEANALKVDWEDIVPKEKLSYIIGNPPFHGATQMTKEQKKEAVDIFGKIKLSNSIDYVGAWYFKACELMQGTNIKAALVSTNSITQGEQVAPLWGTLMKKYGIQIDYAYRTFYWDSEANIKAHVHCVIIGFSLRKTNSLKRLYEGEEYRELNNISPYLIDDPNSIVVESRSTPLGNVGTMVLGNKPTDGGNFILSTEEMKDLQKKEPNLEKFIHKYVGAEEFINGKVRYCLWLKDATPSEIKNSKELQRRIDGVRKMREESSAKPTREKASTPHLFFFISQPDTDYLIVPSTSSMNRAYVPIGFLTPDVIASNSVTIIPSATLYQFGVLTSNVHMAWLKTIGGRLKSDYRYSGSVVYNTFPWCNPTTEQKEMIEATAKEILDARESYPNCSLADLYDKNGFSAATRLKKAHIANDKAVMRAYGFSIKDMSEEQCVVALLKMYQNLIQIKEKNSQ